MENSDSNQPEKKFPVREGSEESSILHDEQPLVKGNYPDEEKQDKQADNQPEFTEEQPNRISPNSPKK